MCGNLLSLSLMPNIYFSEIVKGGECWICLRARNVDAYYIYLKQPNLTVSEDTGQVENSNNVYWSIFLEFEEEF